MSTHPLYTPNSLVLDTIAHEHIREVIEQWLWNGSTGGVIYGEARIGKTLAIRTLQNKVIGRNGRLVPSIYFSVAVRDTPSIATMYRLICNSMNIDHTNRDRADHLSDTIVHHLVELADKSKSDILLLFVDEMQRLSLKQLNIFAELYDRLLVQRIHLMTVFIGNHPQCMELIELTKLDTSAHIRGRFFTQYYRFKGLASRKELEICLAQYDSLKYPDDGPTYTEYFLPDAYQKGFRFISLSSGLWNEFELYAKQVKIKTWPMQYFVMTANVLLMDLLPSKGVDMFCKEMVLSAFEISGMFHPRFD